MFDNKRQLGGRSKPIHMDKKCEIQKSRSGRKFFMFKKKYFSPNIECRTVL